MEVVIKMELENTEEVRLADLEKGSLFQYGDTIGFKSEYSTNQGAIEAYIFGSGEFFWGGVSKAEEQRNLMVKPIKLLDTEGNEVE